MPKTATINVRVEPELKAKAEKILAKVGISTSETITMLLHQIVLQKGVPFDVKVPNAALRRSMADLDAGLGESFAGPAEELHQLLLGVPRKTSR